MSKKRLLLSLFGLAAAATLVWFGGPLLAIGGHAVLEGEMARLAVILVMVLVWALLLARRLLAVRRADDRIAEGISEPAEAEAVDAEQEDAIRRSCEQSAALQERFREAVAALRKSRKNGVGGLSELPWYVIIGPPGAGKTTILKNSGLRFPLAERFGDEALRGVGGTRDCDWWFTDEAILLDTAGRFVTQDSDRVADREAWATFLGLLKLYRRRRPINGVVVAISLVDVIAQRREAREQSVRAIKQRMDELRSELGLRLPVYMVFTKSDLVAGFTEFFDDLGKEERAQVWGTSFAADESDAGAAYARDCDGLIGRLNARLLWRLAHERDPRRRALLYAFPQQMASLKEAIGSFVAEVAGATRYEAPLWVRGVYFTSGTQEGAPIDRMMGALARALGLDAQRAGASSGSARSYFISELLLRVIFPEAGLVGSNRRLERRRAWLHAFAYGAAALTIGVAVAGWSAAYTRNQEDIGRLLQRVDTYQTMAKTRPSAGASFDDILQPLQAICASADSDDTKARHAFWEFGLYQGAKLAAAARRACLRELNRSFAPLMAATLAEQLRAAGRDTDLQFAALKAYLMLAQPQHLDPAFLKAWMQLAWERSSTREPQKLKALSAHLDTLLAGGLDPLALDQDLIKETRLALNRLPLAQLVYGRLKNDALSRDDKPLRLRDLLGPGGDKVFATGSGATLDQRIPRLFTYRGYYEVFLPQSKQLTDAIRAESWVLDNDRSQLTADELGRLSADVAALYFSEYAHTWQTLLFDLQVVAFRSLAQAQDVLAFLSGRNSVIRTVLQAVERNTSLTRLPDGGGRLPDKADGTLQKAKAELSKLLGPQPVPLASPVPGADVESKFAEINALVRQDKGGPAPIDAITEQIAKLFAQIDSPGTSAPGHPPKPDDDVAARHLREIAVGQPQPVKDWLLQLAANTAEVTAKIQKDDAQNQRAQNSKALLEKVNAAWSADVLPFCVAAVSSRYPIDKRSGTEVTPEDFGKLFAPGGLIDAFVKQNLKPFIDSATTPWRWRPTNDIDFNASAEALRQLEIAAAVREAYFRNGSQSPAVEFALKPILLDSTTKQVTLDIGGQKSALQQGPAKFQTVHWPAPAGGLDASLSFESADGKMESRTKEGAWGLFRLFDDAKIDKVSADRLVATFHTERHSAQFEIRASSVVNPFQQQAIERFRCPKGF